MAVGESQLVRSRIDRNQFVIELKITERNELVQIVHESACARIPEVSDVVHVGSRRRNRSSQPLLQIWAVYAWTEPVCAHVLGGSRVVLPRIFHRKSFGKGPTEAGHEPIRIVLDRALRLLAFFDEIGNHFYDDVVRKTVKMELDRVKGPVT